MGTLFVSKVMNKTSNNQMKIIQDQQKKIETTKVENRYLQFITDSKLPFLTYYVLWVIKSETPGT